MTISKLHFPEGAWQSLFDRAMSILDELAARGNTIPTWSLGGGTVLMFYYEHRKSKDIDIFIPDPQLINYLKPDRNDFVEGLISKHYDNNDSIKLQFKEGDIDFVATSPLTKKPYTIENIRGREIKVETPVEIVAKKMFYRGTKALARDLFDLALVIEHEENTLSMHGDIFKKHADVFLDQCQTRLMLRDQFNDIDKIRFDKSYDDCLQIVTKFLRSLK
jgi:hypothetical protein